MRWLALTLLLLASSASAQENSRRTPSELRVATKVAEPFVIRQGTSFTGLAIDLWEKVVARMERSTGHYAELPLASVLEGVGKGEYDVAVGSLTVTADRESTLDFTHPILTSGLGMAVRSEAEYGIWAHVSRFFSSAFLEIVATLVALLLVCGALMWILERRANPVEFGARGMRGLANGIWWAAVTMTTVGYGDRSPRTAAGRTIALIWMFASLLLLANYTAAIASALTVERLEAQVDVRDLPSIVVGTERGSSASGWLREQGYERREFDSVRSALVALERGDVGAVVHDKPILRYLTRTDFTTALQVLPNVLRSERYAFAVKHGSPLREEINRHILEVTTQPAWIDTLRRYLGH